ncbi:hypothetical protein CI109_102793 [Kwoniella shandongensis]|uniref:Uncharacterized protein n=1 Tax=Kwoniella shandongensis TaxID=1734106 RepID=A0A5M6BVA1_9TREE|nr:uncharacterized protein CI109_004886 [Kwoniella shandongensis]KAA5526683.1 hypothetical protein CI109_004886 [Kwoniella shandongensis]
MATAFATQLQPFEENQSPSPQETTENPYEVTLSQRHSRRRSQGSGGVPTSPIATVNTLHRQLSGDPESPPPAWKRRSSVSNRAPRSPSESSSPVATGPSIKTARSPSQSSIKSAGSGGPPSARRHPNLMMTTAIRQPPVPLPNGMFLHESPNSSSTNLADLALPNPAFRRRPVSGVGSNRSSISSSQDLSSLTSEELWTLNHEQEVRDMSNPTRPAMERPLDTIRRLSKAMEQPVQYHPGLPGDVIWPSAPPENVIPPIKSKSYTNVTVLGSKSNKRMSKRGRSSRQSSIDTTVSGAAPMEAKSTPVSPVVYTVGKPGNLSSAHSSSTSLASQNLPANKSFPGMIGQPPSTYYSRDFLSSLAPREGGYAIAATMGGGLGAAGSMSVEEKRRSVAMDDARSRSTGSRAPMAKSAGMGRWSLDGGEHYGRPYATPSAATTSSNLSAPPVNSADPSPPIETASPPSSSLPAGASPAHVAHGVVPIGSAVTPVISNPAAPSPLSQQTSAEDVATQPRAVPPPPPIPTETPAPALVTKKSKKQLAKDAKVAEKAEAVKVARARAEAARAEALKKQAAREAEVRAKEDAKRKEKEEKANRKMEKKAAKGSWGILGRKQSTPSLQKQSQPSSLSPVPPLPSQPNAQTVNRPAAQIPTRNPSSQPSANSNDRQNAPTVPVIIATQPAAPPVESIPPPPTPKPIGVPSRPQIQPKRSLFGTIKKRFSYIGSSDEKEGTRSVPPVPKVPNVSRAGNSTSVAPPVSTVRNVNPGIGNTASDGGATPRNRDALPVDTTTAPIIAESAMASSSQAQAPREETFAKLQQATSRQTQASVTASPAQTLAKTVSRENAPGSPLGSLSRKRGSVMGPRPMPRRSSHEDRPRPASIDTEHTSPNPNGHSVETVGAPAEPLGAPVPFPVTPSTSGDSALSYIQSHASHVSTATPITSPSDTDAGSANTKDSASEDAQHIDLPERESSKDSNETVLADREEVATRGIVA